jgi:hypothetical protein
VILFSARELEPYHVYDRVNEGRRPPIYANSISDFADITHSLYFNRADPGQIHR